MNLGISRVRLSDEDSFTVRVTGCPSGAGECGPHDVDSTVSGALASIETGAQWRLRPWSFCSVLPGVLLGYAGTIEAVDRGVVACADCPGESLHLETSSAYLAPFVRVTFTRTGWIGLNVRSQWPFTGDLVHITTFGLYFLQP